MDSCPLCGCVVNKTINRLIEELCGHKKCRNCFIQERSGCKICQFQSGNLVSATGDLSCDMKKTLEPSHLRNGIKKYNGQMKLKTEWTILSKTITNTSSIADKLMDSVNGPALLNDTCAPSVIESNPAKINEIIPKEINKISKMNKIKDTNKCSKTLLPAHILSIESGENTTYECSICKSKFKFKYHYKYHEFCKTGTKPFKCDICQKVYKTLPHLKYHKKIHTVGSYNKCNACEKQFAHIGSLNRHVKTHTNESGFFKDENVFKCKLCNLTFKSKDLLKVHTLEHRSKKTFACSQCKKTFNDKSNFRKHLSSHDVQNKKYLCELCGKSYKFRWSLLAHKLSHSRHKTYKCLKCSSNFTNHNSLKRHLLVHSSKQFACVYCDIKCRRKDNLERHIRNTHPEYSKNNPKNFDKDVKRILSYDKPIKKQIVSEMNMERTRNIKHNAPVKTTCLSNSNDLNDKNTFQKSNIVHDFSLEEKSFRIPVINGPIKLSFKNMQHSVKQNMYKNINNKLCEDHHLDICRKILQAPPTVSKVSQSNSALSINYVVNSVGESKDVKCSSSASDSFNDKQDKEYQHIEIYRKILMPSYAQKDKAKLISIHNNPDHLSTAFEEANSKERDDRRDCDNHVSTITLITGNKINNSVADDER